MNRKEDNSLGKSVISLIYGGAGLLFRQRQRMRSFRDVEHAVQAWERKHPLAGPPIVLMNISSRSFWGSVSFNSATDLLIGWALRLKGHRVIYYSCQRSLLQCQRGADWRDEPCTPEPCRNCVKLSQFTFPAQLRHDWGRWPDSYDSDLTAWLDTLQDQSLMKLRDVIFEGLPLGRLGYPSLMWALNSGDPAKDKRAPQLLARYIVGAAHLARCFRQLVANETPLAVVVFSGLTYPEAVVLTIAREQGVPVITYEAGLREGTTFLAHNRAVRFEVEVPKDFELSEPMNKELDDYLTRRFKGNFTVGGLRFWPKMKELDENLLKKISCYRQLVPIFTNVSYDAIQKYANVSFDNMFDWLNMTMSIVRESPDTLFVVRAHPDEARPGKPSREPVGDWLKEQGWLTLKNVEFIGPNEHLSSYELIHRSKFVLVYSSTIGLESLVLGKPMIAGGAVPYQDCRAVLFPPTPEAYHRQVMDFLTAEEMPGNEERRSLARRYYYYILFKTCLDLSAFLGTGSQVPKITINSVQDLMPENSQEIDVILRAILHGEPFRYR